MARDLTTYLGGGALSAADAHRTIDKVAKKRFSYIKNVQVKSSALAHKDRWTGKIRARKENDRHTM